MQCAVCVYAKAANYGSAHTAPDLFLYSIYLLPLLSLCLLLMIRVTCAAQIESECSCGHPASAI